MLKQKIKSDLDNALKQQNKVKLAVLRNLWAELKNKEIDVKKELDNQEVIILIKRQVKVLAEAKELFAKGGRADLADKNQIEIKFLQEYLPIEIAEAELEQKVKAVLVKHQEITNRGQLIGLCINELKTVADSSRIAKLVNRLLQA